MQNAEANPTQQQQKEMAAKSPAKTPAAGDSPDAATQAKEFGQTRHASSAEATSTRDKSALPSIDMDKVTREAGDPVQRANSRIVSVDSAGMDATDNTVDTDGKSLEAKRDASVWHDNVVTSNATLDNYIPAPAAGLGGVDSRPAGNLPEVRARDGYRVVYCGTVYREESNGTKAEQMIRFERIGNDPE
ncbi:DUF3005 domain-containing protein [Paraburkholderia sp. SUR17]|uniref:DUF3005 domain-containing protein n=1 Tax=Paraburkholderia sp. SUR17 TaxID=3034358 RepID=UPI00240889FF|nr:DUF3005 domain-containing protein [Paraburkholderia sp. SUR17]WEY43284.1 DUF3005 domain-containing protein [Paraburkholderia sp. SUR17]